MKIGTPAGNISFFGENLFTFQVFSEDHIITRQKELGLLYLDATWGFDEKNENSLVVSPDCFEKSAKPL